MNPNIWLFQIPEAPFEETQAIIEARIQADPGAQAISDEEAENFMATAIALAYSPPHLFEIMAKTFGRVGRATNKSFRRQTTLQILRSWRNPRLQKPLLLTRAVMQFDNLPAGHEGPERVTLDVLVQGYNRRQNVIWLCNLLRQTGQADQIPAFLDRLDDLDEYAPAIYRTHLHVGRLMLRRIVDRVNTQKAQTDSSQHVRVQLKERRLHALLAEEEMEEKRSRLARQERQRKAKEAALSAYLDGVRQEVAAAEDRLAETVKRQEEEITTLQEEHQRRLSEIDAEIAVGETLFAQRLAALTAAWPLADLRVWLEGECGEAERLQIETLGGRLLPSPSEHAQLTLHLGQLGEDRPIEGIFRTAEKGPVALERLLHRRVLPHSHRFRPN